MHMHLHMCIDIYVNYCACSILLQMCMHMYSWRSAHQSGYLYLEPFAYVCL